MSQSGYTPIQLYRTSTAAAVPTAGNLAAGELAINLTDEALYFKNAAGVVTLLADSSGALGSVTSVAVSGGTTGLTTSGGPITTSGTITLAGTLAVANGGTGTATAFTSGSVVFAGASGVYTQDNANLFWDNTNDRLGIGTASPAYKLTVAAPTGSATIGLMETSVRTWGIRAGGQATSTFDIADLTAGASRLLIDSSGNVGIGTVSPQNKLDIVGNMLSREDTAAGATPVLLRNSNTGNNTTKSSSALFQGTDTVGAVKNIGSIGFFPDDANYVGANLRFLVRSGDTTPVERMRIDSSGNVGIGTSSPGQKLDVGGGGNLLLSGASTGDQYIRVGASRSGNGFSYIDLQGDTTYTNGLRLIRSNTGANASSNIEHRGTGTLALITQEAGPIAFLTTATERARITSAGSLLVGTTATEGPGIIVSVSTASGTACTAMRNSAGASSNFAFFINAGASSIIGSITNNADTGVLYNVTSDARLKKNIADADSASSLIDALQVRKFDWKENNNHQRYGFIAQELVEVAPEAVNQPEDPDATMGVDYSKLVPMLVKEIQSMRARLAQLEGN